MHYSNRFLSLIYFFCFFLLCENTSVAQDIEYEQVLAYARKVVDTLASPSMHGRGYVNEGEKIAAKYLENEFQIIGLNFFKSTYRQEFSFQVNTFPGEMIVKLDGRKLVPGKDYIVSGGAKRLSGVYKIDQIDVKDPERFIWKKSSEIAKRKNHALVIHDSLCKKSEIVRALTDNFLENNCTITIVPKLTWEVPTDTSSIKIFLLQNIITSKSKKIFVSLDNKFIPDYKSQNIIGYIPGSQFPDSFIVFSAHYDHLGQMGKDVYFPGANDNASGCAMLLNLAKYYSMPSHKSTCSIVFIAFAGEEAGLIGSRFYTEHPLFPLKQIKFLINMDIMGTGDEGITVVNGSVFTHEFNMLQELNTNMHLLSLVKIRGKAANSDHYFFSEKGVKSFFIYTMGGIKAYHDIYDRRETLPLTKFVEIFRLLTNFESELESGK